MAAKRRKQSLTDVKSMLGFTCLKEHILPSMLAHPKAVYFIRGSKRSWISVRLSFDRHLTLTDINERLNDGFYANSEECWKDIINLFKFIVNTYHRKSVVFNNGMMLHKHLIKLVKMTYSDKKPVSRKRGAKKQPELLPTPKYYLMSPRYDGEYSPRMLGCVDIIEDLNYDETLDFPKYFWHSLKNFPEYYRVIKYPMNLHMISEKLACKMYVDSDDFCSDVLLMIQNSFKFGNLMGEFKLATMMLLHYFDYRYQMLPPE